MASSALQKPGTKHGPCAAHCEHQDCCESRQMAASACPICNKPIGYGNQFYDLAENDIDPFASGLVHASCYEQWIEQPGANQHAMAEC